MTYKNPKLMIGLLNSKLVNWYFDKICGESGVGTNRWKKFYVEAIPVPKNLQSQSTTITALVEQIIETKKQNPSTDTADLEHQIDELVMNLYELTKEEKEIIRNS